MYDAYDSPTFIAPCPHKEKNHQLLAPFLDLYTESDALTIGHLTIYLKSFPISSV